MSGPRSAETKPAPNAIKFSPKDSVVDLTVRDAHGGVEILVADRGPGVPDALKSELFKKFGSVEARSAGERTGFGLGLYLVQLVMNAHDGRATASDRRGGGTVLSLFFPHPLAQHSSAAG